MMTLRFVLVASLLLLSFLASDSFPYTGKVVDESARVVSSSCTSSSGGPPYTVCADVEWSGDGYVKVYIPGTSISKTPPHTERAFTACREVSREGTIPISLYEYRDDDRLHRKSLGARVSCGKTSSVSSEFFEAKGQFTAEPTSSADGSGTYVIEIPRKATSCRLDGSYRTVNTDPTGPERGYCHGAQGTFFSSIDQYNVQSTHDDRDYFFWRGTSKSAYDPPAESVSGYLLSTTLCDAASQTSRTFVKARGAFVGRDLEISWTYHNDDSRPRVEYFFTTRCELEPIVQRTSPVAPVSVPVTEEPAPLPPQTPTPYSDATAQPARKIGIASFLYQKIKKTLTKTI